MVLEHVLLDDDAVDVVGAGMEAEVPEGKPHSEQRNLAMRDVVEEYAAEGEQLEVFVAAHVPDGELVCLRLECPYHKTLETLCDILCFANVVQVFDDFFGCLDAPEYDICTAGKSFFVAGGERVAPLLCREFLWAQHLAHAVGKYLGACSRNRAEARFFQRVQQFVQ